MSEVRRYGPIWVDRHGWTIRVDGEDVIASPDAIDLGSQYWPEHLARLVDEPRFPVVIEVVVDG